MAKHNQQHAVPAEPVAESVKLVDTVNGLPEPVKPVDKGINPVYTPENLLARIDELEKLNDEQLRSLTTRIEELEKVSHTPVQLGLDAFTQQTNNHLTDLQRQIDELKGNS